MSVPYTRYPRATMWLLREGELEMGGLESGSPPSFRIEVDPFYISKGPITNEQFEAFAPHHVRAACSPDDDSPAVGIGFRDALSYCDWYAELSGKAFRLPTEVEWEYACRGETTTRFFFGDDVDRAGDYVWDSERSDGRLWPIETLRANPFGIHDMLGSVWEWTHSLFLPYPIEENDGRDDRNREGDRVLRGGSFRVHRSEMSCSMRRAGDVDARLDDVGFRIVRTL